MQRMVSSRFMGISLARCRRSWNCGQQYWCLPGVGTDLSGRAGQGQLGQVHPMGTVQAEIKGKGAPREHNTINTPRGRERKAICP